MRIPILSYDNNSEITQYTKILEEIIELRNEILLFGGGNRPEKLAEALDVIQATITYLTEFYSVEEIKQALKQHEQKHVNRNTDIVGYINLEVS